MNGLAQQESYKIEKLKSLKYHSVMSLMDFNRKLRENNSKIFLQDKLTFREEQDGTPEVGQIIVGIKFWHYQEHIGIITETGKEYRYSDLTITNEKKSIPLEWQPDVSQEKIDKINKELDLAIEIAETFVKERKAKEKEWKEKEISLENEKRKKALELI